MPWISIRLYAWLIRLNLKDLSQKAKQMLALEPQWFSVLLRIELPVSHTPHRNDYRMGIERCYGGGGYTVTHNHSHVF